MRLAESTRRSEAGSLSRKLECQNARVRASSLATQAMALEVTAKNPFGDEMSFWIVEWRTALIQRPPAPLDPLKSAA